MSNPLLLKKKNTKNKGTQIPSITSYVDKNNFNNYKNFSNNYNFNASCENKNYFNENLITSCNNINIKSRKNLIFNILKKVNILNKKLLKKNSLPSVRVYQSKEKNKKKLLEKFYQFNYNFNHFMIKKKKNVKPKKTKIKKDNSPIKIIQTFCNDLTIRKLKFNKTQPNLSRKIVVNKKKFNRNNSLSSYDKNDSRIKKISKGDLLAINAQKNSFIKTQDKHLSLYISYLNDENIVKDDTERLIKSNGRFNHYYLDLK
jgi:hypothetical protein